MGNERQRPHGTVPRSSRSNGLRALRTISRIVSSSALSVASSVKSAASSIVERDEDTVNDQVIWSGFDEIEHDDHAIHTIHKVLLLSYRTGFQVWDVEEAHNVCELVSSRDGPVSLLQMLPSPIRSKRLNDRFESNRPLMAVCTNTLQPICNNQGSTDGGSLLRLFSLKSKTYVHAVKFRSRVYSVRCSSRILAVSQASQIHCFDAATLEREYTIITNPLFSPGCGGSGYGPLAVGCRWLAYSGGPVTSNSDRVDPENLLSSPDLVNGLVAHYAKESSRQLAAGIAALGDIGYKRLSRYCSELLPDSRFEPVTSRSIDFESVGMVIVRDIGSKSVVAQFRAHKSPVSALCFDPSGMLLVTASVHGHSINVFRMMLSCHGSANMGSPYVHLYRLQRGVTNAVIQDVSVSADGGSVMASSVHGTSHLFMVPPGQTRFRPVTISPVSRIRSGSGKSTPGVIASSFRKRAEKCDLLVFSCSGSLVQYTVCSVPADGQTECGERFVVEPVQKWNVCQKRNRRDHDVSTDIYGENVVIAGGEGNSRVFPVKEKSPPRTHRVTRPYISDAELMTHPVRIPIWLKFYFERVSYSADDHGEIEVESVITRPIESRSGELVPLESSPFGRPDTVNINEGLKMEAEHTGIGTDVDDEA